MRHDLLDEARVLRARDAKNRVTQSRDARAHRRAGVAFHASMLMMFVVVALLFFALHHFLPLR
jgi:hypothetical protein